VFVLSSQIKKTDLNYLRVLTVNQINKDGQEIPLDFACATDALNGIGSLSTRCCY